jgi:hypothetical protein
MLKFEGAMHVHEIESVRSEYYPNGMDRQIMATEPHIHQVAREHAITSPWAERTPLDSYAQDLDTGSP